VLTIAIAATGCGQPTPPAASEVPDARLVERARLVMGTELRLTAWIADEATALAAFDAVFTEFDRLDRLMSVWKDGSDVVRLNAAAGDHPVSISADTRAAILAAHEISEWTDGKFDVTFGVLSGLWKFDHDQDNQAPDMAALTRLLPLINYKDLKIDVRAGTGFLERKGMRVHLGGIGKGYAIDRARDILRTRGVADFMIQSGGDLYVGGLKDGQPWRLGLRDPRGPADQVFATIALSDATFSTAGDYERFFIKDGRRYHHIIDPDTGEPARGCRSVTIVTSGATLADGVDTGVFLLGPDKGMALIERLPDVEGVIVTAKNEVLISSGLRGKVKVLAPPTDAP
jgi:thiamine biosynthesis lipoprotein